MNTTLPLVVIGPGPVGLAAAVHLVERGLKPLVLEAGDAVGAGMSRWRMCGCFRHGHTRWTAPRVRS